MEITFLRHGKTDLSGKGYLATKMDLSLNDIGIIQAKKSIFMPNEFDSVYSSPYKRTIETAKIVYPYLEPIITDLIIQRDFGVMSETYKKDYDKDYIEAITEYKIVPDGAESLDDIKLRIDLFFKLLFLNENEESNILVVTHNGIMRIIKKYYLYDENTETKNLGNFKMKIKKNM